LKINKNLKTGPHIKKPDLELNPNFIFLKNLIGTEIKIDPINFSRTETKRSSLNPKNYTIPIETSKF
jgi:hypothetical protein